MITKKWQHKPHYNVRASEFKHTMVLTGQYGVFGLDR